MRTIFHVPGQDVSVNKDISVEDCKEQIYRYAKQDNLVIGHIEETFIIDIICHKRSVFLTGSAGTGKSTVTKLLQKVLHYFRVRFSTTAPTGVAASHLGGRTIHSQLSIGLGPVYGRDKDARDYSQSTLLMSFNKCAGEKIGSMERYAKGKLKTLRDMDVMIVDEVSMLAGKSLLDFIDYYLRKVRKCDKPFGGLILVFVGDFLQLPPVSKSKMYEGESDWAFQSKAWIESNLAVYQLTTVHRQADPLFAGCLETIRKGDGLNAEQMNLLRQCYRNDMTDLEILDTTYIMPTNRMCDEHNLWAVSELKGELESIDCTYMIRDEFTFRGDDTSVKRQLRSSTKHKETLFLKRGSEVLITVNDAESGYYNGTRARVYKFEKDAHNEVSAVWVYTRLDYTVDQLEEKLASGVIVVETAGLHKLERKATSRGNHEPVDEVNHAKNTQEVELYGEEPIPRYPRMLQFPMIPANAVTVHSSQGMTLEKAVVNTDGTFAYGQVYVAMSRVKTVQGLTLVHHDICNPVDPAAKEYHLMVEKQATDRPAAPC